MRIKLAIIIVMWLGLINYSWAAESQKHTQVHSKHHNKHPVRHHHLSHHHKNFHHHIASSHLAKAPALIASQSTNIADAALPATTTSDNSTDSSTESIQQQLVTFTKKTIATLHYSAYKLGGTRFDPAHGVYVVDCSHYVDHILHTVYPHAYSSLVRSTGSIDPNTANYYHFFAALPNEPVGNWSKVDSVDQLQPGDILVIRYQNHAQVPTGGHVMIVMNRPVRDTDAFLVRVADSAKAGHSYDTRRHSGIGIGTLLLKADPTTGQPYAYAWKAGSYWKDNASFAMGRPV